MGKVTVYNRTSLTDENKIIARIGAAEVVITNKVPISKRVLSASLTFNI